MTTTRYAGFWIRLVADILDSVLLTVTSWLVQLMLMGAVFWVKWLMGQRDVAFWDLMNPFFLQVLNVVIYGLLAAPYYILGHFKYQTTLGKLPLGIYVVSEKSEEGITLKQSIIRFCAYLPSYLIFAVGFIMAAYHPRKMALHDLIAGTVSIRRNKKKG